MVNITKNKILVHQDGQLSLLFLVIGDKHYEVYTDKEDNGQAVIEIANEIATELDLDLITSQHVCQTILVKP